MQGSRSEQAVRHSECFTGALEPEDAEKKKRFLQKAVLRLNEWQGWTSSPDRSAMLGAAQAAQALGIYLVEMGEYDDARSWLVEERKEKEMF